MDNNNNAQSKLVNESLRDRVAKAKRVPARITITIPYSAHEKLVERSQYEGRSMSNLAAALLELGLNTR